MSTTVKVPAFVFAAANPFDVAGGRYLDALGSVLGLSRKGETDQEFRFRATEFLKAHTARMPQVPPSFISMWKALSKFSIKDFATHRRRCAETRQSVQYEFDGGRFAFYPDPDTATADGIKLESPRSDGVFWVRA